MGCGKSKTAADGGEDKTKGKEGEAGGQTDDKPKIIVVFGATGTQGGSVARALKTNEKFVVKAVTRNPDSDKAKQLANEGIEVIKADMDDADSCKEALKGAYGVFLVMPDNLMSDSDADKQIQQGKNVVDAAKENSVEHLIFSGDNSPKEIIEKDGCSLYESKKTIFDYIVQQEVPYTQVKFAFYYENLTGVMKPKVNENNEYVLDIPVGSQPLCMICASEAGEVIHQMFARPDEFKGQTFGLASQRFTVEEYATILSKIIDTKKFIAGNKTVEDMSKSEMPQADQITIMFEMLASGKVEYDVEMTRKLNPTISTFEQWVENNRDAFDKD